MTTSGLAWLSSITTSFSRSAGLAALAGFTFDNIDTDMFALPHASIGVDPGVAMLFCPFPVWWDDVATAKLGVLALL